MNFQDKTKEELIIELQELLQKHNSLTELYFKDISELKQTEVALKISEEKFRAITETASFGIYLTDLNGKCIYVNERWCQMAQLSFEQALGDGWVNGIYEKDREKVFQNWDKMIESNGNWGFEYRFGNDDEIIWVYGTAKSYKNDLGEIAGYVGTNINITERKIAELKITESEERYKNIANCLTDYLYTVLVEDGKVVKTIHNDACIAVTGYSPEDFLTDPFLWINMVVPEERSEILSRFLKIHKGNDLAPVEHRIICKDGKIRWISDTIIPKYDIDGKLISYDGVIKDITARKCAEEALIESEAQFKNMFQGHNAVMLLIEPDSGRIIDANDSATKFYGYDKPMLLSMKIDDINTLTSEQIKTERLNAVSHNRNFFIFPHRLANGEERIVEVHSSPIDFNKTKILFSVIHDITDRIYAEEELKRSETILRTSQKLTRLGGWEWDVAKQRITWTDETYIIHGIDPNKPKPGANELLNISLGCYYPEDRSVIYAAFNQCVEEGKAYDLEFPFMDLQGKKLWIHTIAEPVFENGKIVRVIGFINDITELKQSKEELLQSEARFRSTFDQSPVGAVIVGLDKRFIRCNASFCNYLGYIENELIGKSIEYITHPEDVEIGNRELKRLIDREIESCSFQKRYLRKNGDIAWGEIRISLICDENNKPKYFLPIIQDVTNRIKAETELIANEKKYRTLFENMTQGVFYQLADGSISDANEAAIEMFGLTREQLLGRTSFDPQWKVTNESGEILSPDHHPSMEALISGRACENKVVGVFNPAQKNNRWLIVNAIPQFNPGENKPYQVFVTMHDITGSKQAEDGIKESELRLRSLVRILQFNADKIHELLDFTLEVALQLTNSKLGYIYFYNEKNETFSLHSWSKGVMKECTILNPNILYNLNETGIWGEAVRQRKPIMVNDFHATNHLKKGYPDGHAPLHNFLTIPVIIENEIVAVIGVANKETDYKETDILHLTLLMDSTWKTVQRKKIEEYVKQQNEDLIKLNADKDLFMSILAHDLKSPFNSLLGLSELLTENIRNYPVEKIEKQVSIINKSAQRIYHLLEDISIWARSQSGKILFEPQKTNFDIICKDVIADLKLIAETKNISVSCLETEEIFVFADIDMLKTILRNLLSNALKFTNAGGRINVFADNNREEVTIGVSDNGIGIKPAVLEKLFDITQKYSSAGTAGEMGTGLGLILCREFVEKHGGKIWVESEEGKGTIFYFTIPVDADLQEKL